jgi:Tfp pilus assembly protein PilN
MFTIDLLKGQGIPIRSGPERITVAAVTFAVPVIVATVMLGFYLSDSIAISIQEQEIVGYERKTDKLADAVERQKSLEEKRDVLNSCLSEVSSTLGRHTQWSSVLVTLVKNMPDSMVLTKLELKQDSIKRQVPAKDNPQKLIPDSVPIDILQMTISGDPESNCDKAVQDFRDRLRSSAKLGPKLRDILIDSQGVDKLGARDVVSYKIDCIFKPML